MAWTKRKLVLVVRGWGDLLGELLLAAVFVVVGLQYFTPLLWVGVGLAVVALRPRPRWRKAWLSYRNRRRLGRSVSVLLVTAGGLAVIGFAAVVLLWAIGAYDPPQWVWIAAIMVASGGVALLTQWFWFSLAWRADSSER